MTTSTATQQDSTAGNFTYYIARTIVLGFAIGCLYFSFDHTIHLAHMLGATGTQAYTAPAFVDGFMLLGRLGMSAKFDAATNKIGRRMMVVGALISLAANIAAGQTLGGRILGAAVVIGFLVTEWYAGKLKPAPAPAPTVTPDEQAAIDLAAKRSAAARKAAETRKANQAAKPTRKPRTRKPAAAKTHPVAAIQALTPQQINDAPVSPAPWMGPSLVIAKTTADIRNLTN
jgi:hypothetical protein